MNSFYILRSQNIVRCFNSMRYAYRPISVSASLLNKAVSLDEPAKVHYEEESDGSIPKNPIRIPYAIYSTMIRFQFAFVQKTTCVSRLQMGFIEGVRSARSINLGRCCSQSKDGRLSRGERHFYPRR